MHSSVLRDTMKRYMGLTTLTCEVTVDERHALGRFLWYPFIEHVSGGLDLINPTFVLVLATHLQQQGGLLVPSLL